MFTNKVHKLIDLAKEFAFSNKKAKLNLPDLVAVIKSDIEASFLLAECLGLEQEKLRSEAPQLPRPRKHTRKLPLSGILRSTFACAKELAEEVPDRTYPALIDLRHLVCAIGMSPEVHSLLNATPISHEDAITALTLWYQQDTHFRILTRSCYSKARRINIYHYFRISPGYLARMRRLCFVIGQGSMKKLIPWYFPIMQVMAGPL